MLDIGELIAEWAGDNDVMRPVDRHRWKCMMTGTMFEELRIDHGIVIRIG